MAFFPNFSYKLSVNNVSNCIPNILPLANNAPCIFIKVVIWFGTFFLVKTTASPNKVPTLVPPKQNTSEYCAKVGKSISFFSQANA